MSALRCDGFDRRKAAERLGRCLSGSEGTLALSQIGSRRLLGCQYSLEIDHPWWLGEEPAAPEELQGLIPPSGGAYACLSHQAAVENVKNDDSGFLALSRSGLELGQCLLPIPHS